MRLLLKATPRYLLYIHKFAHKDGRVQYPIAFVLFMPPTIKLELKVLPHMAGGASAVAGADQPSSYGRCCTRGR